MQLPQSVLRELSGKLVTTEPPSFGQVEIKLVLHYSDREIHKYQLSVGAMETLKL